MLQQTTTPSPAAGPKLRLAAYGLGALALGAWLVATLASREPPPPGEAQEAPTPPAGQDERRLFSPEDLGLLEGPDREGWQKPDQIMDALGIADGSVVADLGAGGGWFTVRLARRVGPNGLVYAEDIQQLMIDSTSRRVRREGLRNVRYVLGTAEDPRLPAGVLDAALMVDIYQEVEHKVELLENVRRALRPTGRLGIVNYTKEGGGPGPLMETRVDPESVIADAEAAGLRLIAHETFLPYQYLLVLGR